MYDCSPHDHNWIVLFDSILTQNWNSRSIRQYFNNANILVWKIIYQANDRIYVDGVRLAYNSTFYPGQSIAQLDIEKSFPWLDGKSQQYEDLQRFIWFSDDFVATPEDMPNSVIDVRYSMLPNEIDALWMIKLDPDKGPDDHVNYVHENRDSQGKGKQLLSMMLGKN